jgi:hypothetical protein
MVQCNMLLPKNIFHVIHAWHRDILRIFCPHYQNIPNIFMPIHRLVLIGLHSCSHVHLLTSLRCDNQGAIPLINNPTQHVQSKHIDVQHHFVRKWVENGKLMFDYCSMEDIVADVLTKALSKYQHNKLIRSMFKLKIS